MRKTLSHILAAAMALTAIPGSAFAQETINFGDDASPFANDGECDDKRFSGPGMTSTILLDSDVRHDATDCRNAYNRGRLTYNGSRASGARNPPSSQVQSGPSGARNPPPGQVRNPPSGQVRSVPSGQAQPVRGAPSSNVAARSSASHIQWGDDASPFSNDGECDDKRFVGPGMTSTRLLDSDVRHDATDCRVAYEQGRLSLRN